MPRRRARPTHPPASTAPLRRRLRHFDWRRARASGAMPSRVGGSRYASRFARRSSITVGLDIGARGWLVSYTSNEPTKVQHHAKHHHAPPRTRWAGMDESRPIFIQIAEQVENDIIDGSLP